MAKNTVQLPSKLLDFRVSGVSNYALRMFAGLLADQAPGAEKQLAPLVEYGSMRIPPARYAETQAELQLLGFVKDGVVNLDRVVELGYGRLHSAGYITPYVSVPRHVIADQRLSCGAFRALLYIEVCNRLRDFRVNQTGIAAATNKSRFQAVEYVASLKECGYLATVREGRDDAGWRWTYTVNMARAPKKKAVAVNPHVVNEQMFAAARSVLKRMVPPDWDFLGKAKELAWALERVGTDYPGCNKAEGILRDDLPKFFDDPKSAADEFWRIADAAYREHRAEQKASR